MPTYITGDKHGEFRTMLRELEFYNYPKGSIIIIAGDASINYYGDSSDEIRKQKLNESGYIFFCIHGNRENRPENIDGYKVETFKGGNVYVEEEYPNIKFAQDGEVYDFDGKSVLVLGGAYSVDKYYRLKNDWPWFEDEQMSKENKEKAEKNLDKHNWEVDVVISHTCPYNYRPVDMFIGGIDQSTVDTSMEEWLQEIEDGLGYKKWYCGHWHTERTVGNLEFLYDDIVEL